VSRGLSTFVLKFDSRQNLKIKMQSRIAISNDFVVIYFKLVSTGLVRKSRNIFKLKAKVLN